MVKTQLKKYYTRLSSERFLKSLLCGLITGFSTMFITALVCWYFSYKQLWPLVAIGLGVAALTTVTFYLVKYRMDFKDVAKRIDELGLEERVLTMIDLEGDDSYIAKKQREDTFSALSTVMPKNIKISVALALLIALPIMCTLMAGASTVYGLHVAGILPSGREVLFQIIEPAPLDVKVQFKADGGGTVGGYVNQVIKEGANADAVVAIPETGYAFSHWTWIEGSSVKFSTAPYFVAEEVFEDTKFTAVFTQLENYEEPIPGLESGGEGNGKGQNGNQNGPTSDTDMPPSEDQQTQTPDPDDDMSNGRYSSGATDERNQILDGETYYGDVYGDAKDTAMDNISQNDDMSDDTKDFIEDYYDAIKKQESEED